MERILGGWSFAWPLSRVVTPEDTTIILLKRAYDDQTQIGWDHMLRGRLSHTWFCAHDDYCRQRHLPASYLSDIVGPQLIQQLFTVCLQQWYARNDALHGSDPTTTQDKQLDRINAKIRAAYTNMTAFDDDDRDILFRTPLIDRLSHTHTAKLNWLLLYESCLSATPGISNPPNSHNRSAPNPALHEFFRQNAPRRPNHFRTPAANTTLPNMDSSAPQDPRISTD